MDSDGHSSENKLDDVLDFGLKVVFCGTAAGTVSAALGQYYAGPQNKFWKTLHRISLTERQMEPAEYRELLSNGIGFTDLLKDKSGMDYVLTASDFENGRARLKRKMEKYQPRFLCFNGKRAAKGFFGVKTLEYGRQGERIGQTRIFVAPSTSAAARRWWDEARWNELAVLINSLGT